MTIEHVLKLPDEHQFYISLPERRLLTLKVTGEGIIMDAFQGDVLCQNYPRPNDSALIGTDGRTYDEWYEEVTS
jgi:hypothetical protein